ncbi:synaptotagmin-like protein 2 isoform X3 [Cyclopterus lumpus]|uniref:synaptotagmin-like protein 2 isoform X3 n=1 Tax=Cyclopterus lumpus TaxID=8103 RepID=UPI001486E560|nr:synaptotagmin-like protein 2 isoform X3 [Cyclopterus lumpus]
MIDLSYLTEEEQGVIMTVMRRDTELLKAEEERVRKLEKIPHSVSQLDTELKYRTGEWFYEAKSRRHMDKIHGSEIILASMKQRSASLDSSPIIERAKTPSKRGSDIATPPKPARCLEALQPQEINDAEKEILNSAVCSPRTPRHNPFNLASLVVEQPENNDYMSTSRDQESSETEPIYPLKSHPAESSQTSGASLTSEGSSVGFRPVPKSRTFRSKHTSSQSESNSLASDALGETPGIVPTPRRSLIRGSNSNQSDLKGQNVIPQKSVVSYQVFQSAPPSKPQDENSQQPLCDASQLLSNSIVKRERNPSSKTKDSLATYTRNDASTNREILQRSDERDDDVVLHTASIQDSNRENNSSVGTARRQDDLSLPQSPVDPDRPMSYALNLIDKSDQQAQKKSNKKHAFQLSTQTTSPTGDEEDSIAKVLDWFSRSTDSLDWPKTEDDPKAKQSFDKHKEINKSKGEGSFRKYSGHIISDRKNELLNIRINHLQIQSNEAIELGSTDRDTQETQEDVEKDARERIQSLEVEDNDDGRQSAQISHLKSFWDKSNTGHKILIIKEQIPVHISAEQDKDKSRKQRQNAEKGAPPRRPAEETETLTPRARAYVPRDYRHYLGMTDETTSHNYLAPAVMDEGSGGKSGYEFDLDGPVRASTPVSLEECCRGGGGKASQRTLWANYSSSDAGQESSVSSTSETWSNSRNSSNRENDVERQNLVRKALLRAEARPKNLTKSMEDITASLSPREHVLNLQVRFPYIRRHIFGDCGFFGLLFTGQETRKDPTADMRHISYVSSIPSPSSSSFSDPEHLKKMSKSVPSFLQKEDLGRDMDSTCEDSDQPGRLMQSSSLNNLTDSSGMSSLSSLSGSMLTMYSADFGNVDVQGNIQFSINYIQKLREFHIFVTKCQDLAAVNPKRGRSDPYVKSYLFPDKANLGKRKTSVKKKTQNPTFNEILRYRVRMEYLRTQTLILSVWHHDTFGRNSFLGEVDVNLYKWDFDHTQMNYLALKARTSSTLAPLHGQGEMRLAIRFLPEIIHSEGLIKDGPNTGEVHIWVKECKNLPPIRATIDPYVKCFVLPDISRKSRQKTRVLRRTVDPAFNHTMVYDGIRQADLSEACVELTVWDQDRLATNLLGGLRLGVGKGRSYGAVVDWMDSTPHEVALWERMMASPNEWVEDVLPLRVLNSSKTHLK